MPHTLYDATVRYMTSTLTYLDHILAVAEQHRPDPTDLVDARLIEDMKPLSYQIHNATRVSARLGGRLLNKSVEELPNYDDDMRSFPAFHARIKEVLAQLSALKPEDVNILGEELSEVVMGPTKSAKVTGAACAFGSALPNVNFHANMAYAILRKEGIPIGKADLITSFADEYC